MSAYLFERSVLSKPFFDRNGLIVAEHDGKRVGFVHAGFEPQTDGASLDERLGVICMLMVSPESDGEATLAGLMDAAEAYLRRRGAERILAGACLGTGPFYLGLFGGCLQSGLPDCGNEGSDWLLRRGYQPWKNCVTVQRTLPGFRQLVDRKQVRLRRTYNLESTFFSFADNWYQACAWAGSDIVQFQVVPRTGGDACATARFWDIEPLASNWGGSAMGMIQIQVAPQRRRQGVATYLLGESLRQLSGEGKKLVELQIGDDDHAMLALCRKLGFTEIDQVCVRKKTIAP